MSRAGGSVVAVLVAAAAVGAAFAFAGCGSHGGGQAPNVVLITMDTVRDDHLGCYGYARHTSPRIDAFAASATRYTRAAATSSWTIPTHASLFTGKFPFEHGAHAFEVPKGTVNNINPLPQADTTLAEVLSGHGYTTGAFCANDAFLSVRWQLNQGFETYQVAHLYGENLDQRVFRWLDAVAGHHPFFLFVNYIDAHRPYNTHPRLGITKQPVVQDHGALLDSLCAAVLPGTGPVPRALAARVIDQYDTGIANLDQALGELLDRLQRLGVYDRTVIVVASDHGEYFGEHHLVEHSKDLYQEGLMVPLIVKAPGQKEGATVDSLVTLADVPSMILSYFPGDAWRREAARFAQPRGSHGVLAELYYTRTKDLFDPRWGHRFDRIRTAFYEWPYKLIHSSDDHHELYDLARDPKESTNLYASRPKLADRLTDGLFDLLNSRVRSKERVEQAPLTEQEMKRLKSLGYVGN